MLDVLFQDGLYYAILLRVSLIFKPILRGFSSNNSRGWLLRDPFWCLVPTCVLLRSEEGKLPGGSRLAVEGVRWNLASDVRSGVRFTRRGD